jgi:hypothetical protein
MMGIVGTISTAVLIVLAGYKGATWLVKTDTKVENRRRAAAELAGVLRSLGLVKTPDFLIDYSVGDYSGMGEHLIELSKLFLSGEAAVVAEFEAVFERCLAAKLGTEQGRAYVAAKLLEADSPA